MNSKVNNQSLLESDADTKNYVEDSEAEFAESRCCCCRIAYFTIGNFVFIGHWRKKISIPFLLSIFYIITLASFVYDTLNTFPNLPTEIAIYSIVGFLFFCSVFSYYAIIVCGPGYVPYNWSRTHQRSYSWDESMRAMALYEQQAEFARSTFDRPRRSCFSIEARRFVLRADHFCVWAKSWIGIKNYRYFMLMCFWSSLYSFSVCFFRYWLIKKIIFKDTKFRYEYILGFVTMVLLVYIGFLALFYFARAFRNLRVNMTSLEVWNGKLGEWNRGCMNNFEEVCGPRKYIACWPFPFAFCLEPLEDGFYDDDRNDRSFISDTIHGTNNFM